MTAATPGMPFASPQPFAPPPKRRRTGLWITVGISLFLVLILGACGLLYGMGTLSGVLPGKADKYTDFLKPETVVPAALTSTGATGTTEVKCQNEPQASVKLRTCAWIGLRNSTGQASLFNVEIGVFPTKDQKMNSGEFAAGFDFGRNKVALDHPTTLKIATVAASGWNKNPWSARVLFAKDNVEVVVDYTLLPTKTQTRDPAWMQLAVAAATQIAARI